MLLTSDIGRATSSLQARRDEAAQLRVSARPPPASAEFVSGQSQDWAVQIGCLGRSSSERPLALDDPPPSSAGRWRSNKQHQRRPEQVSFVSEACPTFSRFALQKVPLKEKSGLG